MVCPRRTSESEEEYAKSECAKFVNVQHCVYIERSLFVPSTRSCGMRSTRFACPKYAGNPAASAVEGVIFGRTGAKARSSPKRVTQMAVGVSDQVYSSPTFCAVVIPVKPSFGPESPTTNGASYSL